MNRVISRILAVIFLFAFSSVAMAEKDWTVLVFINGHNNLDEAATMNLNQMENVGSTDAVNIVAEWGSLAVPLHTKRLLMQKDHDSVKVTSPVVADLGEVDMGSSAALKDFLLWGIKNYPAKHYFAVVWDHGSGWHLVGPAVHAQDISYDEISGHQITTEQLGQVIREVATEAGHKIDIYGSDACLMAMAEVAGEMTGAIDYFVGSQELEPENGWPYDKFLADLVANPGMAPAQLSSLLAEHYVQSYDGVEEVTFSAYDMAKFPAFLSAMKALGSGLTGLPKSTRKNLLEDVVAAQNFDGDYGDVGDLLVRMKTRGEVDASSIQSAQQAVADLVISNHVTKTYASAHGISVWLPQSITDYGQYSARYENMNFNQLTQWSRAISSYLN